MKIQNKQSIQNYAFLHTILIVNDKSIYKNSNLDVRMKFLIDEEYTTQWSIFLAVAHLLLT